MRLLMVLLVAAALGCGGLVSPSGARAELESRGIAYNGAGFLNAARAGDLEVVRLFVDAGMSVNTASTSGVTALHYAAYRGHLSVVKYLVGQGARLSARDENGYTARDYAMSKGHGDVLAYLVSVGG